jgi:hypothetical protein
MSDHEQLHDERDYGGIYRSPHSPQQNVSLRLEGGSIAIGIALLALGGVIVGAMLLPLLSQSQSEAAVAVALRPISAQVASAQDRAWLAERDARVASDEMKILQVELAKRGIFVRTDGHAQE